MIKEIEQLRSKLDQVNPDLTPEDINEWRTHPVTQQLFRDATLNFITSLDLANDVPIDAVAIAAASQAKGERNTYEWLLDWSIEDESNEDNSD